MNNRTEDLRKLLWLFDLFAKKAPLPEIVEDLNKVLAIYRSELQCRDSLVKYHEAH